MNTNFKYRFVVVLALAAVLLQAFSFQARAASETCAEVIENAEAAAASIDIPARRADYTALERIGECNLVSGVAVAIPVTGSTYDERFLEMKDLQAEMLDHSADTAPEKGYQDPGFMDWKARQAEGQDGSRRLR